jgi:hypothetical protein
LCILTTDYSVFTYIDTGTSSDPDPTVYVQKLIKSYRYSEFVTGVLFSYHLRSYLSIVIRNLVNPSVVEPEPQGAGTFGRSRNVEVSAPAPGQLK